MSGFETRRDVSQAHEAGEEQSPGRQQDRRQRHFDAGQPFADPQFAAGLGGARLQRLDGLDAGKPPCRSQPAGGRGELSGGKSERHDAPIHLDFVEARQIDGRRGGEGASRRS